MRLIPAESHAFLCAMTEAVREMIVVDRMDPARAAAMHAAFDGEGPAPSDGDPLPRFWHHLYFWDTRPPGDLGPDGHVKVGVGLVPDTGLAQRMWAGGDLAWHAPLRLGREAVRTSRLERVDRKEGRSGPLAFVTILHEISQDGRLCVAERQDLVYRGPMEPRTPPDAPDEAETIVRTRRFSSTDLFRYSALTMNGHRIHYDLDYATSTEGYAGLVVHGPLLAQGLIDLAGRVGGEVSGFSFRAVSPLICGETARFCASLPELWVTGPDGRLRMRAEVRFRAQ